MSAAARCFQPGRATCFRQFPNARDIALPFGHRDHPARVQQIEYVACLDALVVGRQRHFMAFVFLANLQTQIELFLSIIEVAKDPLCIGEF